MPVDIKPIKDKVLVRLQASPDQGLIRRPQTDTPIRRCEVLALGPDASPDLSVGQVNLVNILSGQLVGDDVLLLPSRPGQSAFLARLA